MPTDSTFFSKYLNPVFVETGSFCGDGIQAAIDAGFEIIHSIELSEHYYNHCKERFFANSGVCLYLGDSAKTLWDIISAIQTPITFWLDGHHCGGDTAFGDKASPLLDELDIIAKHPIKTHTILIDDLRCWNINDPNYQYYQFGLKEIKDKLKTINPEYEFMVEDSTLFKKDILVAQVRTRSQEKTYSITAIVSTYNASRFMRGCLEDLEGQTIADRLEIIVIDSGSLENEGEIVMEFQQRHGNIQYIRTERESVYAAWNRAIKMAKGKYLTNANTDDRHRKDAFEVLEKMLDLHPEFALVYGDIYVTETPNETFEKNTTVGKIPYLAYDRQNLLNGNCLIGPQPMWRASVHGEYGYFDETMITSGDYEFWMKIAQTHDFYHINQLLGLYLERPDSVEHSNRRAQYLENEHIVETYQKAAKEDKAINRIDGAIVPWSKSSVIKLGIGIPLSFPWVPSSFFHSFIHMDRPTFSFIRAENGSICGLRNQIVETALAQGITHLIMMDVDQVYHPQTVTRLLSHRLPVVGALVHRRYPPFDSLMLRKIKIDENTDGYESIDEWNDGELVEVDATGGGCLMFDMEVFRKLPRPWFRDDRTPEGMPPIGEDIGICQDLKAAGYRIFVDTSVPAGHLATLVVNTATNRLWRAMKSQQQKDALGEALKSATKK